MLLQKSVICAVTRKMFIKKEPGFAATNAKKSFNRVDSLKRHKKVCCKCSRCAKQFETLNLLSNHNCFSKEATPMKKCNSVAVNNGKFIFDNHFVCNLKIVVSHR